MSTLTGYAPAPLTNLAPQLNPQRSQIAALMGSRPGIGMPAPQTMPAAMPMGTPQAMPPAAPMGQPPMGLAPALPRPVMRLPQSMMR